MSVVRRFDASYHPSSRRAVDTRPHRGNERTTRSGSVSPTGSCRLASTKRRRSNGSGTSWRSPRPPGFLGGAGRPAQEQTLGMLPDIFIIGERAPARSSDRGERGHGSTRSSAEFLRAGRCAADPEGAYRAGRHGPAGPRSAVPPVAETIASADRRPGEPAHGAGPLGADRRTTILSRPSWPKRRATRATSKRSSVSVVRAAD